jgi:type II secretory pathway pseudopilin PulG
MRRIAPMRRNTRPRAFTAIELLVTIGIIVLIAGLLLPTIVKSLRAASRQRVAADLNTVKIGLDAFKGDFGTYPAVESPGSGFAVLGKTMIGPFGDGLSGIANDPDDPPAVDTGKTYKAGECVSAGANRFLCLVESDGSQTGDATKWLPLATTALPWDCRDGFDGPGFRARLGGKSYGPYLAPGKFKTRGLAILDSFDNPIMYFPPSARKINLAAVDHNFYVSSFGSPALIPGLAAYDAPMFNFDDNGRTATSLTNDGDPVKALARMQAMMGAVKNFAQSGSPQGALAPGESPATTDVLLWSCGPDGRFGPVQDVTAMTENERRAAAQKCDDVTNFGR